MTQTSQKRRAFTLIELLVVIAIIAILVALIGAGVINYLKKGPEMQTRSDITNLDAPLQAFKGKYGLYPPQAIKLVNFQSAYNLSNPFDAESLAILNRMWPNISKGNGMFNDLVNPNAPGIPWADGIQGNVAKNWSVILEGDQCLVFFLGGIPLPGAVPGTQGFSNNPLNPAVSVGTADRSKPFFEFKSNRLKKRKGSPFYSYYDAWEAMPYLYFSSTQRYNYNYAIQADPVHVPPIPFIAPYHFPIPRGVTGAPLFSALKKYHAPESFQIISAGADMTFNPGVTFPNPNPPPSTITLFEWAPAIPNVIPVGVDDMTSFYGIAIMGAKQ